MSVRSVGWLLFAGIAVAGAAADLATKAAAFSLLGMPGSGRRVILLPEVFVLETNLNEGALFGMGQGLSWLFAAISVGALAGIAGMMAALAPWSSGVTARRCSTWKAKGARRRNASTGSGAVPPAPGSGLRSTRDPVPLPNSSASFVTTCASVSAPILPAGPQPTR